MFSRFIFSFVALFIISVIAGSNSQVVPEVENQENILEIDLDLFEKQISDLELSENEEGEPRNPLLKIAINILKAAFKWAATHCIKECAHACKAHWNNPKALIDCGKNFFKTNKGRCVLG